MVEKPGKVLEKMVSIVEQVFIDNPETKIFTNYRIENTNGNKREFDIFIKSIINGFDICVVIECKDYSRKISIDKIEAFHAKCESIPSINKKVYVSVNGFQKGAIDSAKTYGIDLYTFQQISENAREIFLPIQRLHPVFKGFEIVGINCSGTEIIEKIDLSTVKELSSVEGATMTFKSIVYDGATPHWPALAITALKSWMKNKTTQHDIEFIINCKGIFFYRNDKKINVHRLECIAHISIEFSDVKTVEKSYSNISKGETKARTLSFSLDETIQGSIVRDQNENLHFFDTSDDVAKKLEVLFRYNPLTDEFEK